MSYDPRGIYSPDSIVWKVHSDPSMLIGGVRALFQQALHPVRWQALLHILIFVKMLGAVCSALVIT